MTIKMCSLAQGFLFLIVILLSFTGCARLERNPVPVPLMESAQIPGIEDIRDFSGGYSEVFQKDLELSLRQESAGIFVSGETGKKVYRGLALSSGGPTGAFGAGFLAGWTAHGSRPDFKLVTGISTGAVIAPFAFLGPEYDPQLEDLFTSTSTETLVSFKGMKTIFSPESLADSTPMLTRMQTLADEKFLARIAEEHNKGKRLLIGTTNIDAGRLVVWNMGKIANSGHPDALKLFHKVILASASIPAIFPPVFFQVEAEGEMYDEMHFDGGVKAHFFLTEALTDIEKSDAQTKDVTEKAKKEIYIIRNGKLGPEPGPVEPHIFDIVQRTSRDMTKTAIRDGLYRVYSFAQRTGADFNYIGVPDEYEFVDTGEFADESEMIRLFNEGYRMGVNGSEWYKTLPGLND